MLVNINGNAEDLSEMLVTCVRYALGRRTYIVDWTCEFIGNNLDLLSEKNRQVMIRDIKEQENFSYGDECDKACWLALLEKLERGGDR